MTTASRSPAPAPIRAKRRRAAPAHPTLEGARVILRGPIETDKRDRLAHGRDPEFRRMAGGDPLTSPPLTLEEVERWHESLRRDPLHWVIEAEGRCIGTARLRHVDAGNRSAIYAIGIFHPRFWSRGYGTDATLAVLEHAFGRMRLHRVGLRVLEFNRRAIACYEKCGFAHEGIQRDSVRIGGEWQSEVLMAILDHEYRDRIP